MANDKVMKKNDHNALIKAAIKSFWETKQKQLTASGPNHYEDVSEDTSIEKFIHSFIGYLIGNIHEFQQ